MYTADSLIAVPCGDGHEVVTEDLVGVHELVRILVDGLVADVHVGAESRSGRS